MRTKRTRTKFTAVQLCLFSETAMQAMTEQITIMPINLFTADPARLYWQLIVGQALRGKQGREFLRTFTQRRVRSKVTIEKPPDIFVDS